MEQKKTLWIVLAAGTFLLVVLGAALLANSQSKNKGPQGSVWISPVVGELPAVCGGSTTKLPGSDEDNTPPEVTVIDDGTSTVVMPKVDDPLTEPGVISGETTISVETATINAGEVTVITSTDKTAEQKNDDKNVTTIDLNALGTVDAVKPANEAGSKLMKEPEKTVASTTTSTTSSTKPASTTTPSASKTESTSTKPASTSTTAAASSDKKTGSTGTAGSTSASATTSASSTNKTSSTSTTSSSKGTASTSATKPASTSTASTSKTSSTSTSATSSSTKTTSTAATSATSTPLADSFWIQAASYSNKKNADEARSILEQNKLPCEVFTYKDTAGTLHYRVRVGPYTTKNEAKYWQEKIAAISFFASTETYITNSNAVAK